MRIDEVENSNSPDPNKLMGLVNFLAGRAEDENAQKQISTDAFITAARSLGFPIDQRNIVSIISQSPLDSVLEPIDPKNPTVIRYKGAAPEGPTKMPVNKAQDIVAASAKSAMQRGMNK
jgi:hypothetical protein